MAKRHSAFTLIEITIALLILAIGLVGLLTLFPVGFDASKRAGDVTVATFLAQQKLEDIKRQGFSDYASLISLDGDSDTFLSPYESFHYSVGVTDLSYSLSLDLTEITVTIYWPTGTTDRNVQLKTYIADYGP